MTRLPLQSPFQEASPVEGEEVRLVHPFLHIDTTDKIMGIPVKHIATGFVAGLSASFFLSSFSSASPLLLLLVPVIGYLAYRISLQAEKMFPGTTFRYYLKWLQGAQVYWPDRDEIAAPLVVPDEL